MNATEKRDFVVATMSSILGLKVEAVAGNFADDVTWTSPGTGGGRETLKGRAATVERCQVLKQFYPDGVNLTIDSTTVEGDRVAVEYHYDARFAPTGKIFKGDFCTVFELAHGKIVRIREYVDTAPFKDAMSA